MWIDSFRKFYLKFCKHGEQNTLQLGIVSKINFAKSSRINSSLHKEAYLYPKKAMSKGTVSDLRQDYMPTLNPLIQILRTHTY
jgi:hypothetical protein